MEEVIEYQGDIPSMDWDTEDAYLLEKIAMAEAEGEGVEGKALVMLVVLNRVWSDRFPDTIEEVIFRDRAAESGNSVQCRKGEGGTQQSRTRNAERL